MSIDIDNFWLLQVYGARRKLLLSNGETREKAIEEFLEILNVLENGMKELFPRGPGK